MCILTRAQRQFVVTSYLLTKQLPTDASAADLLAALQQAQHLGLGSCAAACSDQLSGMPELPMSAARKSSALPSGQDSSMTSSQLDMHDQDSIQQLFCDLDAVLASKTRSQQLRRLSLPGLEVLLLDGRTQMASRVTPLLAIAMWSVARLSTLDNSDKRRVSTLKADVIRANRSYTSGAAGSENSMSRAALSARTNSSSLSNGGGSLRSQPPPPRRGSRARGVPPPRIAGKAASDKSAPRIAPHRTAQAGPPVDNSIRIHSAEDSKRPVQRVGKETLVFIGKFLIGKSTKDMYMAPSDDGMLRLFVHCSDGTYRLVTDC